MIQAFFDAQGNLDQERKQFKEDDYVGYRDKDGLLVLPKEWDDEEI